MCDLTALSSAVCEGSPSFPRCGHISVRVTIVLLTEPSGKMTLTSCVSLVCLLRHCSQKKRRPIARHVMTTAKILSGAKQKKKKKQKTGEVKRKVRKIYYFMVVLLFLLLCTAEITCRALLKRTRFFDNMDANLTH